MWYGSLWHEFDYLYSRYGQRVNILKRQQRNKNMDIQTATHRIQQIFPTESSWATWLYKSPSSQKKHGIFTY